MVDYELLTTIGWINLIVLAMAVGLLSRLRVAIYHPSCLFCLYYLIGFVARPFKIAQLGYSEIWRWVGFIPTSHDLIYTALAANIGLFGFVVAPLLSRRALYERSMLPPIFIHPQRPQMFAVTTAIVGLLGLIVTIWSIGSGTEAVQSYEVDYVAGGGQALVGTSGYITMLADYLIVAIVFLLCVTHTHKAMVAVLLPFLAIRLYLGSGRSTIIAAGIITIVVLMTRARQKIPRWRFIAIGLVGLLCFDVIGSNRFLFRQIVTGDVNSSVLWENYRNARSDEGLTSDFSEFDTAAATVSVIEKANMYNIGLQYTRLLLWPIPRQLWPDKPVIIDRVPFESYGNFQAITRSMIGDSYSDFGLPSVLLMTMLVSLMLAKAHVYIGETILAGKGSAIPLVLYLIAIGNIPLLFRDNFVSGGYFVLVAVPAVLLIGIGSRTRVVRQSAMDARRMERPNNRPAIHLHITKT